MLAKIFQINSKTLLIISGVLFFLIFLRECNVHNKVKKLTVENELLSTKEKFKTQSFDSLKSALNIIIYRQKAILVENEESINILSKEVFNLKKRDERNLQTIAYLKSTITTHIDTVYVPYKEVDSVPSFNSCEDSLKFYIANTIIVPKTVEIDSPHFKINENILKDGVRINSLEIIDTVHQRIVENKKSIEVQFFHTNPYVKTTNSNSVVLDKPKRTFWQKFKEFVILVGIGVGAGILISK